MRMSNLHAKFASALVLGVVAGAAAMIVPQGAARAADNCLTEPKGDTPQGKHWYFHIERGTGRHCWYLRGQDDKAASANTSDAPAEKQPPQRSEEATSRSIANAHAEIAPRVPLPDDASAPAAPRAPAAAAAPSVWPSPQATTAAADSATTDAPAAAPTAEPSPVASRWPQASSSTPPVAAASQPDASLMVADTTTPDSSTASDPAPQAVPPQVLAAAPVERNTGSLQKLLLVAFGALTLAGLTGSAVYRLGRRRRRNDWLRERTNWRSMDNPLDPPWVGRQPLYANPAVPDLDEARNIAARSEISHALESDEAGDRVEKIEEFLARLTRQLQAEMEGPARAERDARAS